MLPPELIVIADDKGRSTLPKTIGYAAVRIIDCRDIGGLSSIGDAPVLIDVDLHDIAKVKQIKDNLPTRNDKQCRIIAVDRGSHLSVVQAKGLDASDLLKRPLDDHELKKCLRRYATRAKAPADEPVRADQQALMREPGGPSVASAAAALDRMFSGFTTGGSLDLASVEQAGDEVMDAICEVGFAQWLDTVRRYHESTFQHCLIVTGVLTGFGHKNGMRKADVLTLTVAGLLHDVGKAQIPIDILDKPGRLTDKEFAVIKQHPNAGYEYIRSQNVIDPETLSAIRHHHEYLDGSGYPDGLSAQKIGDLTRIMTVCDVYGALIERRAYKAPKSPQAALDILTGMAKDGRVESDLVRALGYSVSA
jgi:putative nucleotidyltransferase with HDIG domain